MNLFEYRSLLYWKEIPISLTILAFFTMSSCQASNRHGTLGFLDKRRGDRNENIKRADALISFMCNKNIAMKVPLRQKGQMMEGSEPQPRHALMLRGAHAGVRMLASSPESDNENSILAGQIGYIEIATAVVEFLDRCSAS